MDWLFQGVILIFSQISWYTRGMLVLRIFLRVFAGSYMGLICASPHSVSIKCNPILIVKAHQTLNNHTKEEAPTAPSTTLSTISEYNNLNTGDVLVVS